MVALFWARRKREGGRGPLVMYRDLAWAQSDATQTHMHTHAQGCTHNHYLKGLANLPDSQPVWQPVMQFQTFVMTG